MVFLAGCGGKGKPVAKTSPAAASAEFTFPQTKCGEESSTPSTNWYPVFIDGAELEAIRSQYCGNAISEVRSKTGAPTVQVASFTSYEKAKKFAAAVGGEVEVMGSAPATAATRTSARSGSSDTTRRTATLASSEPGSPINIRQSASIDASVQEIAYAGDSIQVSSKTQGEDGYTWYKVELDSGASGWVRSDLINAAGESSARASTDSTTVASAATEPSSTASPSPSTATSTTTSTATSTRPSSESSSASIAPSPSESTTATAPSSPRSSSASSTSSSGRSATISVSDPGSPINVRSGAGTDSEVQDVAYGGDRIQITDREQGSDGQTWYKVEFESGASGWVRSDFISN
jgi:uncharacterized protein YgiM (DUF1202 family)